MDEATAYLWAAQCLNPLIGKCEPYLMQQVADKVASAIMASAQPPPTLPCDRIVNKHG